MIMKPNLARVLMGLGFMLFAMSSLTRAADPGLGPDVDLTISKTGPATIAAGANITYTMIVTGVFVAGAPPVSAATLADTLPAGWTVVSITTTQGNCSGVGTGAAGCTFGAVGVGSIITVTLTAHVPGLCQPASATNRATVAGDGMAFTNNNSSNPVITSVTQPNVGPGQCYPSGSPVSSTKPGSILIYPFYISSPSSNSVETNTRIALTNTNPTRGIAVHLFFIDGSSCSVADAFVCLTPNQTTAFLASDIDPGVSGYIIAVASDGPGNFGEGANTGCPISFNYLIGHQNVKLTVSSSGIGSTPLARTRAEAELEAESVAAEFGSPVPGCDATTGNAVLRFNGQPNGYNRLPRVLAASNILSRLDGNFTYLVVNRIGGDLSGNAATLGTLFGLLYDDSETPYSFSLPGSTCQLRGTLSGTFPRTVPRFDSIIGQGRSGWMRIQGGTDIGITGATINNNFNTDSSASAFDGGHMLHKLTLTDSAVLTIPVFPPSC